MSETYCIHNTTRSLHTRLARMQDPANSRTVLLLSGGSVRVVRGRPVIVDTSTIQGMHAELVERERLGQLIVMTPAGARVDLSTLKPSVPAPVPAPLPHPPVDSAANDKNEGVGEPALRYMGNIPATADVPPPAVGQKALPDEEVASVPSVPPPAEVVITPPSPPKEPPKPDVLNRHNKHRRR